MPSSTSPRAWDDSRRGGLRLLALWSGILAGPVVWLALLEANYVLSYLSCTGITRWVLQGATIIAALIVAAAGLWGWRTGSSSAHDRERWMACAGAASTVFFLLVIAAFEAPILILRPCV
jgi:hypothetical protein